MATYILQKDLPNIKSGAEFEWNSTETWVNKHEGGRYVCQDTIHPYGLDGIFAPKEVENNPEWFKLKQEKITVVELHSVFSKTFEPEPTPNDGLYWYQFKTNIKINPNKKDSIKKAIEFIVNGSDSIDVVETKYSVSSIEDKILDKKYTVGDMFDCWMACMGSYSKGNTHRDFSSYINSLNK